MEILILPKDSYPFQRVRLSQLFMIYFASKDDIVHWIAYSERKQEVSNENNHLMLIRKSKFPGGLGHILSKFTSFRKFIVGRRLLKIAN